MPRPLVPVVLCGGSGARMWPLSRRLRPKQLLPLTGERSLLLDTLHRLEGLEAAAPLVVCGEPLRFAIAEQLAEGGHGAARVVVEPAGRNTAPAVGAAAHLAGDDDPLLLILPSDHHIADPEAFREAVRRGLPLAEQGHLVVFGVTPHKPETGYGWIRRGAPVGDGFEVDAFTEKPDADTARAWMDDGRYAWNAGMFLFRASAFLEDLQRFVPRIAQAVQRAVHATDADHGFLRLGAAFADSPSDSIDYAVMERTERAVVVPLDAGWSDVGSWSALWEVSEHDDHGNALLGDALLVDTADSYVRAGHRLVVTVGVRDHVVIETPDAVLVAPRHRVQDVRDVVEQLKQRGRPEADVHTVVERPWGAYEVLDAGEGWQVKRLQVRPGEQLSLQLHARRAERWVVVAGAPRVVVDGEARTLAVGDVVAIDVGVPHRLENPTDEPALLVEVQVGDVREDDIVRLADRYGREEDGVA